jgi:hypothetical protein
MSDPVTICVKAVVDSHERATLGIAATLLESSLSTAAGAAVTVRCQFETSVDGLNGSGEPCIIISSLLPELTNYQEPWSEVENRLRQRYQALMSAEGNIVFLCTVFRHVAIGDGGDQLRRIRVRRLNLLAAQLSHETGLFIIDLDRSFADIGASKLDTDYRLSGQYASEAAAKFVALAVLSAGLDDFVSFEIQDSAKAIIAAKPLNLIGPALEKREMVLPHILKLGSGRRKQVVATMVDTDKDSHAGWLIHLLITRQYGMKDAFAKLKGSIARRGLRSSLAMVFAAAREIVRNRASLGR